MARFPPPRPQEIGAALAALPRQGQVRDRPGHRLLQRRAGRLSRRQRRRRDLDAAQESPFALSGTGGGEIFLRGTLDKLNAEPQIAKRAEYKSAADMFMEKQMSPADREQLTALMNSVYDAAVDQMAANRHLTRAAGDRGAGSQPAIRRGGPQPPSWSTVSAMTTRPAPPPLARAGAGAKSIKFTDYVKNTRRPPSAPPISPLSRRRARSATAPPRTRCSTPRRASPATTCRRRSARRRATRTSRPSCCGWIRPAARSRRPTRSCMR